MAEFSESARQEIRPSKPQGFGGHGSAAMTAPGIDGPGKPYGDGVATANGTSAGQFTIKGASQDTSKAADYDEGKDSFDNDWLKSIDGSTTNVVDEKRIWSPRFDDYYQNRRWMDTYKGRLLIRTVARGVTGTAFYAIGQMIGNHSFGQTGKFDKDGLPIYKYDGSRPKGADPLHWAAWIVDKTYGEAIFRIFGAKGITFRETRYFGYTGGHAGLMGDVATPDGRTIQRKLGRGLGHDAIMVFFDFGMMSFAENMSRYVIELFDPSFNTQWKKYPSGKLQDGSDLRIRHDGRVEITKNKIKAIAKDGVYTFADGKKIIVSDSRTRGKFDFLGGMKELGWRAWKAASYAAGEDLAVCVLAPYYPYFMKWQRNVIDHFSPGFRYDSDHNKFGASYRVDNTGKIIGDYNLEGTIDLTTRFAVYNVGTKFFRTLYNEGKERILERTNTMIGDPESREKAKKQLEEKRAFAKAHPKSLIRKVGDLGQYVIVNTTKVMSYMIPTALAFGILRTPQRKTTGLLINPNGNTVINPATSNPYTISQINAVGLNGSPVFPGYTGSSMTNEWDRFTNNMYGAGDRSPWYSRPNNFLARLAYGGGRGINGMLQGLGVDRIPVVGRMASAYEVSQGRPGVVRSGTGYVMDPLNIGKYNGASLISEFSNTWADASISYTPYFMLKSDLSAAWLDTNRSDEVIWRWYSDLGMLGRSVITFDGDGIKKHARRLKTTTHELSLAILKKPYDNPRHEGVARFVMNDESYKSSSESNVDDPFRIRKNAESNNAKAQARAREGERDDEDKLMDEINQSLFSERYPRKAPVQPQSRPQAAIYTQQPRTFQARVSPSSFTSILDGDNAASPEKGPSPDRG